MRISWSPKWPIHAYFEHALYFAYSTLEINHQLSQDLISLLGGGERVGEAALRQTLELTAACAPDSQRLPDSATVGPVYGGTGCATPPVRRPDADSEYNTIRMRGLWLNEFACVMTHSDELSLDTCFLQANCTILENEITGVGFGGCLLHLLRLGSISSLSVVQAREKQAASVGRLLLWAYVEIGQRERFARYPIAFGLGVLTACGSS